MTLRLKIFPVFMYPDCFRHVTAKAKHSTMEICAKPSKTEKETNQVTWWPTLKQGTPSLGLPLQLAPTHSWMCALMVGSIVCSVLGRAESLPLHSGFRTWHLLLCQSHFMEWTTPQEHSSAWSQGGTPLPLRYRCSHSCCAASRGMQKPHSGSPWSSIESSCTHPFPSFCPIPRTLAMQSSHHPCSSRLSSKCCLGWFSNLQGCCISRISLPAQRPFPGGIHTGHFWGQWQIHHTAGIPALPSWGQGVTWDWFFTKTMSYFSSSWGNRSDSLGPSLPGQLLLLQAPPKRKTSCPSSPSKQKVGKCNSLSTACSHIYSAWTSDSNNFVAEIPCRQENTEYTLSKCLLALAGYSALGRGGYIQSLKLFQASQSSRQQNTCGCIGTRCFQSAVW